MEREEEGEREMGGAMGGRERPKGREPQTLGRPPGQSQAPGASRQAGFRLQGFPGACSLGASASGGQQEEEAESPRMRRGAA